MTRYVRMSNEWADSTYEDRRIAQLQRGPLHTPAHPLRAELGRNSYGGFYAWLRGWGYPTVTTLPDFAEHPRAAEDALDALVANGYALVDTGHLIELFDLFDGDTDGTETDDHYAEMARSNRGPVVTAELAGAFTPRCDDF